MSDPTGQQPGFQPPGYQQPGYQQPGYQQPGYQQPGYPAYPQYGNQQYGSPPPNMPIPGTLNIAVVLMYIGGAIDVIGFVADLADGVSGATAFGALVGAGLWFLIATMCRQGKNWARITGTVLFGIDTLVLLLVLAAVSTLAGHNNSGGVALIFAVALIPWLIGLSTVVLLWRAPSSAYFKVMSGMP